MGRKLSGVDKAIAALLNKRAVLDLAIAELEGQRPQKAKDKTPRIVRKPRAVPDEPAS